MYRVSGGHWCNEDDILVWTGNERQTLFSLLARTGPPIAQGARFDAAVGYNSRLRRPPPQDPKDQEPSLSKKSHRQARSTPPSVPTPAWLQGWSTSGGWGRWVTLTVILLVLLAILYPDAVLRGSVFASSDAGNADAFRSAGDAALRRGHYPLWNPFLFAGMPSFGSLSYARFLYPPSVVFDFVQQRLGFPPLSWMLAHLLFGGLGMAWVLSRWRLPLGALVLGAAIWLLFPKVVAWGVHGHGTKLGAAMYLPWIVGWVLRILDGHGWRAVGMTGLLLGLQLLRGHPQITYYTLLLVGWLSVWNAVWPLDDVLARATAAVRWRRVARLLVGLALGFMIGSVLLVPVHQYSGISIRGQDTAGGGGVGLDYATGWSLAPVELGTVVLPAAAGFGKATYLGLMPFNDYPNYLGLLVLVLAVWSWWQGQRSLSVALGAMSVIAILVAFGRYGPGFYELLYRWLPFFNKFRVPSMVMILVAFAAAILAPRGLVAWRDGRSPGQRPLILPMILGAAGLLLLLSGVLALVRDPYQSHLTAMAAKAGRSTPQVLLDAAWVMHRASLIRIGLMLLVAASAGWFAVRNEGFRRRGLIWVLALLVCGDLLGVDRLIVYPERQLQEVVADAQGQGRLVTATRLVRPFRNTTASSGGPGGKQLAAAVEHERVWPLGNTGQQNLWMADAVRSLGGYHPAKLARYEQIRRRLYGQQPAGRLASWLAGRVVLVERALQAEELEILRTWGLELDPEPRRADRYWLYTNRAALPRARLVSRWRPVDSLPEKDALEPFLDGIEAGTIVPGNEVVLDQDPVPAPEITSQPLPMPRFEKDDMDEVVLTVDTPVPALLLLSDMMAPGWSVEVDGRSATLLTADLVLRAVALDRGSHSIRFQYRDPAVRAGLTLSVVGVALALALLVVPLSRRFRKTPVGVPQAHE